MRSAPARSAGSAATTRPFATVPSADATSASPASLGISTSATFAPKTARASVSSHGSTTQLSPSLGSASSRAAVLRSTWLHNNRWTPQVAPSSATRSNSSRIWRASLSLRATSWSTLSIATTRRGNTLPVSLAIGGVAASLRGRCLEQHGAAGDLRHGALERGHGELSIGRNSNQTGMR